MPSAVECGTNLPQIKKRSRGSGGFYLNSDNTWSFRFRWNGRRLQERTRCKDLASAELWAEKRMDELARERQTERRRMLIKVNGHRSGVSKGTAGAIAELAASTELLSRGYAVYRSISPNSPCDLVAIKGRQTLRIEVKATVIRNDCVVSRAPNKGCIVDHVALVLEDGTVLFRPPLRDRATQQDGE